MVGRSGAMAVRFYLIRHGRACPGHPDQEIRYVPNRDARVKPGHDKGERDGQIAPPSLRLKTPY
jgi:hypothetical protein